MTPTKKPKGLVDYSGLPTAVGKLFEVLPESKGKGARKRVRAKKKK